MGSNLELFASTVAKPAERRASKNQPLADLLRPVRWEEFQGLEMLDGNLIQQLRTGSGRPPSLILWGPPGSGKTTFARLVGNSYAAHFVEASAVLVGVKDIREIATQAKRTIEPTVLFVDEIHRLNKGQQDAFLPHVESGTFSLLGATTENPSFYLTGALLSRARVLVLASLDQTLLERIVPRACEYLKLLLAHEATATLCQASGGDARRLLNLLESLAYTMGATAGEVTQEQVVSFLQLGGHVTYDRAGDEHYNMASAFIKSMRGSNPDAALYWCFRMIGSGEDPRFLIRRMIIFASEDIGNADPRALTLAVSTAEAFDRVGLPEGRIPIAQCVTYLASAPKSNRSYVALNRVLETIKLHPKVRVPLHLRNAPTELMKELGYSAGYQYPHDFEGGKVKGVQYLPDELRDTTFYEPTTIGHEKIIAERLKS